MVHRLRRIDCQSSRSYEDDKALTVLYFIVFDISNRFLQYDYVLLSV